MSDQESAGQPDAARPGATTRKPLRIILLCILSLMVLTGAYVGWWSMVASQFEQGLDQWIARQSQQGWQVQFDKRVQSGFPGAIDIRVEGPSITGAKDGQLKWTGDHLSLSVKPWAIDRLAIEASGNHRLQRQGGATAPVYQVRVEQALAQVQLVAGQARSVEIHLAGLAVEDSVHQQIWHITGSDISAQRIDTETLGFKIRSRDMTLPASLKAPLGEQIGHFDAKGQINGNLELQDLPDALVAWRDNGGTLDIATFDLDYPPLRMRGAGTVALDSNLQPEAAFTVQAEGFFATIDALQRQGLIEPGTSFAAKVALAVLSKKPKAGGNSYLEIPLTVQDRTLYAGSLALLKLRPVAW